MRRRRYRRRPAMRPRWGAPTEGTRLRRYHQHPESIPELRTELEAECPSKYLGWVGGADDALGDHRVVLLAGELEEVEVDLLVVLTQAWRRQAHVVGCPLHLEEVARVVVRAHRRHLDALEPLARAQLRIGQGLHLVVHGRGADARRLELVEEWVLVEGTRQSADLDVELVAVLPPLELLSIALIRGEVGLAQRF